MARPNGHQAQKPHGPLLLRYFWIEGPKGRASRRLIVYASVNPAAATQYPLLALSGHEVMAGFKGKADVGLSDPVRSSIAIQSCYSEEPTCSDFDLDQSEIIDLSLVT